MSIKTEPTRFDVTAAASAPPGRLSPEPDAPRERRATAWRSPHRRFGVRLVAVILLVSLPLMTLLAIMLTRSSSSSLSDAAERDGERSRRPCRCGSRTGCPNAVGT